MQKLRLPLIPASFFAMVLGLIGLGNAWRAAHRLWDVPAPIGEAIIGLGLIVWIVLLALYILKWFVASAGARAELADPVGCCFIGLAGVSTMLVGVGVEPYAGSFAGSFAGAVFAAGAAFTYVFGIWRTGFIWRGSRDHAATTPVLYLPLVAGSFVFSIGLSAFGHQDWAQLAFGAGFFTWLAIESVLLHRLYTAVPLPEALRPTLGIQLAPPAVGALAYVQASGAAGDMIAHAMIGYALLMTVLLARMLPWIVTRFSASLWGFSFGLTALASVTQVLAIRGETGPMAILAPTALAVATLAVGALVVGTIMLLVQGKLLPRPLAAAP